ELRAFLERIGPVEIVSDAPLWDWPLLVWLAGPEGLPDGVTAGRIGDDIEYEFDDLGYEPPHHALEDARLLAALLGGASVRSAAGGRKRRRPPYGGRPNPSRRVVNATRWPPSVASVHPAIGGRKRRRPPYGCRPNPSRRVVNATRWPP